MDLLPYGPICVPVAAEKAEEGEIRWVRVEIRGGGGEVGERRGVEIRRRPSASRPRGGREEKAATEGGRKESAGTKPDIIN